MHKSAMSTGKLFFDTYWKSNFRTILDIGALDVNGSLRSIKPDTAQYIGVDIASGIGVDTVIETSNNIPYNDCEFDIIISTSCFEHDEMFWNTFLEMCRLVNSGGYIYINVPMNGWFHRYPTDCWRFYPDAGIALEKLGKEAGISLVESFVTPKKDDVFSDLVMVFGKNIETGSIPHKKLYEYVDGSYNIHLYGNQHIINESSCLEDGRNIYALYDIITQLNNEIQNKNNLIDALMGKLTSIKHILD